MIMKQLRPLLIGTLAMAFVATVFAQSLARFEAKPGSKVKIEGTSTVHDWAVEGGIIAGAMELDPKFVSEPTKAQPGKVEAKAETTIPVRTIKSGKSLMDSVMHNALKLQQHPQIRYRLTELTLKETPKSADGPFLFDSKGELAVAGVTNKVAFPVTMTRANGVVKTTGSTDVKMTSFGIQPPSPTGSFGLIKTGDDVKLTFEWVTAAK